jgi:excisionase family DNA binding protein
MTHTEAPEFLTTDQIARRYNVNEDTARRWIRTGRIPGMRLGGAYRVRLDDLERLEREGEDFSMDGVTERPSVEAILARIEAWADHEPGLLALVVELRGVLDEAAEEAADDHRLLQRIDQMLRDRERELAERL